MDEGYAICFNEWALDKDIKNELGLLIIISSLTAEKGYCFASNKYFAELFKTKEETISRKIKILEKRKYISVEYEKRGSQVISRKIRLTKISTVDCQKYQWSIDKNVKDNNTSINNTSINKKEIYKERFKKPTLEEVKEYCLERQNGIDAEQFIDYYDANGWVQGKNKPVKDWKACIRTWEKNRKPKQQEEIGLPDWFYKDLNKEFEEQHHSKDIEELIKELEE